ncbi:hypothetical protein DAMA08_003180 [Martiniozyma asiatica (nom. inval.)]|nr:hypothetical protein DAMA08_003180 [Martiniozyma asiatica]
MKLQGKIRNKSTDKSILNKAKVQKLKFKNSKVKKSAKNAAGNVDSDNDNANAYANVLYNANDEDIEIEVPFYSTRKSFQKEFIHKPSDVKEYGPSVNGYRFIAFNSDQIPACEGSDTKEDKFKSSSSEDENEDNQFEDDSFKEKELSPYEQYLLCWERMLNGESSMCVPLPVIPAVWENVSFNSVMNFIPTKKLVQKERIRWHPDKMVNVLKKYKKYKDGDDVKVTHLFQVLNEVFEKWNEM